MTNIGASHPSTGTLCNGIFNPVCPPETCVGAKGVYGARLV